MRALDLTGQRFGRLTVLRRAEHKRGEKVIWVCRCDCGAEIEARVSHLRTGNTRSCGCFQRDRASETQATHRMTRTPEHAAWRNMKARCYNQRNPYYDRYGARGIVVDAAWLGSFEQFLRDMGPRPSARHSLDRKDANGPYAAYNCRWATASVQCNNWAHGNHHLELNGERRTIAEWARHIGMRHWTIRNRLRLGWPIERALTSPAI